MKQDDILVCRGGYDCTHVTFFKVIKIMNGFATVKILRKNLVSYEPFAGTFGSGTETPIDEFTFEETIRRKIKFSNYDNEPYIRIAEYELASLWDGTPQQFDLRNI